MLDFSCNPLSWQLLRETPRGRAGNKSDTINFFDSMNKVEESLFIEFPVDSILGDLTWKVTELIVKINGCLWMIVAVAIFISLSEYL